MFKPRSFIKQYLREFFLVGRGKIVDREKSFMENILIQDVKKGALSVSLSA